MPPFFMERMKKNTHKKEKKKNETRKISTFICGSLYKKTVEMCTTVDKHNPTATTLLQQFIKNNKNSLFRRFFV